MADVARGEDADLRRQPERRADGDSHVRPLLVRARSEQREERERADREEACEENDVAEVVEHEPRRVPDGVVHLPRRLIGAEELARRPAVPKLPAGPASRRDGERRERRPHAQRLPAVERECGQECGHERHRLKPRRKRDEERGHEERLARDRRPDERLRHRPRGEDEQRIERDLGQDQARVDEPRNRERQRGREEREPRRDEPAAPEVDGHRRERHHERLDSLQQRVPERHVREAERPACESRIDEAEEARPVAEEGEGAVRVEAPAELRVDQLVGRDPRRRDPVRGPEAQERRNRDESREQDGGRVAAERAHR